MFIVCASGGSTCIVPVTLWPSLSSSDFARVASISTAWTSWSRDPREPLMPSLETGAAALLLLGMPVQPTKMERWWAPVPDIELWVLGGGARKLSSTTTFCAGFPRVSLEARHLACISQLTVFTLTSNDTSDWGKFTRQFLRWTRASSAGADGAFLRGAILVDVESPSADNTLVERERNSH